MPNNLKIWIIWTGFWALIAQNFLALDPNVEIYLSGSDNQKAKIIAEKIGALAVHDSWEKLASDTSLDILIIASTNHLHAPMCTYAMEYQKDILLEKPAGLTSEEIKKLNLLSQEKNVRVFVNHEGRFSHNIAYIRWLLWAEKFGDILTVRCQIYQNMFSDPNCIAGWWLEKKNWWGQINAIAVHQIDIIRYLLDFPKIITGGMQTRIFSDSRWNHVDTETQFTAHYETDSGISVQISNDTYCQWYKNTTLEIIGSKWIMLYSDIDWLRLSFSNTESLQKVLVQDVLDHIKLWGSLLTHSMKYMAQEILDSLRTWNWVKNYCTLGQAYENMSILEKYKH